VHASDVAQAFELALSRPAAIGASFHVVAGQTMTLRGLAAGVARWFGREPVLKLVDWAEFERRAGAGASGTTREHTDRSITASIDRARQVLGYAPRYSSLEALHEALTWLVAHDRPTSAASGSSPGPPQDTQRDTRPVEVGVSDGPSPGTRLGIASCLIFLNPSRRSTGQTGRRLGKRAVIRTAPFARTLYTICTQPLLCIDPR
jgi:hypothetical protein